MVGEFELNKQGVGPDVGGKALQLESLEAGPSKQCRVVRCELAEVLRDVFVRVVRSDWLLLSTGDLSGGVLADGLVGCPVRLLAIG